MPLVDLANHTPSCFHTALLLRPFPPLRPTSMKKRGGGGWRNSEAVCFLLAVKRSIQNTNKTKQKNVRRTRTIDPGLQTQDQTLTFLAWCSAAVPFQFSIILALFLDLFSVDTEPLHCFMNASVIMPYSITIFYPLATRVHVHELQTTALNGPWGAGKITLYRKFALKEGGRGSLTASNSKAAR